MTMATLDDWRSRFSGFDLDETQVASLRQYLRGAMSVTTAAQRLAAYPNAAASPLAMQQRLGGLWELVNDTAVQEPTAQPAIVSLLLHLRTLPGVPEPPGEGAGSIPLDYGDIWKELTQWANDWADSFNYYGSRARNDSASVSSDKQREWTNACAYAARLDATNDPAVSSYGAGLERAMLAVVDVLETDLHDDEPQSLQAAAAIFQHDSPNIHQRCREETPRVTLGSNAGELWNGGDTFTLARWHFWEERWATFAGTTAWSASAQKMADEALASMRGASRIS